MRTALACTVLALFTVVSPVVAAPANGIDIRSPARISADGQQVSVRLAVTCPAGWDVLEANISVSQGSASGRSGFGVACTGHPRNAVATVTSFGSPYVAGQATASAFILLIDPATSQTMPVQASETINLH